MAYANGNDLIARFDARIVGDLLADDDTRVAAGSIPANANALAALDDASSMINSACQVGQRYTQAQLAALSGTDAKLLVRLACDLAFIYLCQRRGIKPAMYEETFERSTDMLEKLRNGEAIFAVPANIEAGTPTDIFPSQAVYQTVNLLRDATNNNFFPVRRKQQPASGGYSGAY
jgi:phage gp36-like protein